jgi:Ser-tRNA(Ala) deacylase AlaX
MTDLLYLRDSYLKEFDAKVSGVSDLGVTLDKTAFYPGGGGQPYDQGTLRSGDKVINVARM